MSPFRYACCPCAKARNEVLGLSRQRKRLNLSEIGRDSNPSVLTRISFIVMEALMIFHTKGWLGRICQCACVCM